MELSELQKKLVLISLGILIILIYFSRLFFPEPAIFSTPDFGHSDLWHLNIPLRKIYWEALQKNQLPLWEARIGKGFPVFAENETGALNIQNLILYRLFPFVTAFNLTYILIFLTTFLGTILLFFEFRVHKFLSFLGALIFTFSGFFVTHIVHPNLIHTASYFPLLFFLLEKYINVGSRHSVPLGLPWQTPTKKFVWLLLFIFFQTQCFLAGFPQFFLIINFFFFLYLLLMKSLRNLVLYIFSIIVSLVLCLPQIIPSLGFARAAGRSNGLPFGALSSFPFSLKHLLSFFDPYIFGNPKLGTYPVFSADWGIFWESTFYVGATTFVIFLLAIILHFVGTEFLPAIVLTKAGYFCPKFLHVKILSSHKTKTIFKIGLLSLFLGLGKYTPFFLIVQLPIFNMFRNPARFNFLFMFTVVFIAIIFLDRIYINFTALSFPPLLRRDRLQRESRLFLFIILAFTLSELLFQFWSYHLILPARQVLALPKIAKYLKKNDLIFTYNPYENWNKIFMKKGWDGEKEIAKYIFLKNQADENMSVFWNINNFKVYASSPLANQSFVNQAIDNLLSKRLDKEKQQKIILHDTDINLFKKYGINIITSPFPISGDFVSLVSKLQFEDLKIYMYRLNIKTFKWLVPTKIITKQGINYDDLAKSEPNTAFIQGKSKKSPTTNNRCKKIKMFIENNIFSINHSCKKNTLLIINQTFYEGNKIIVNGIAKKGTEVNVSQTGIWL